MSASVTLTDVAQAFPGRERARLALDGITLTIEAGQFVCVVGPSGCGKSTLLDLVAGHTRPARGSVAVADAAVKGPGLDRVMVFQDHALFPWMSVADNVGFGLKNAGISAAEREATVATWLAKVGLTDAGALHPHQLSGGMRQRAALARAFAMRPQVLLMDEPFSALDAPSRDRLHVELQELWADTETTIIFVTHNVREAVALGDRVIVLSSGPGRIIGDVPVSLARPRVVESERVVTLAHKVRGLLDEADQLGITTPREGGDSYVAI
ncbi:ABC transporter ATP-binding protein [Demequina sp. B12]|uniref:ABC transporter ATP-binding protein n=1 Tax=Demequina sp. B12 TaxID=2992757 RepID=UPI00237C040D|nr:ABC transporter ATP-binding protein [Demequina sp. B12]MDE0572377.1 ABC transporter ATP-binding protein [Demequina sp. B12]